MTPLDDKMPDKIRRLPELAYNLWWSWNPDARSLFKRLDFTLWRSTAHSPVNMLREIDEASLQRVARDSLFMRQYEKVLLLYDREMTNGHSWFSQNYATYRNEPIAYFSAEFGLHNSLPIYSGGLGILSGDHTKEASDLGIPLVGFGFMYPQGYFRQQIPSHGWQEAIYELIDIKNAPVLPVRNGDGSDLKVSVTMSGTEVWAKVWNVRVGRIPLYLLDTDVDENDPWNRELSARLYSGDADHRIRQEIMLGIGGVRALRKIGVFPRVWHMNEGHSAFLVLELMREYVKNGLSPEEARAQVKKHTLFTTHTPVPAGHDAFTFHTVEQYFAGFWDELGLSREQFFDLGTHDEEWGNSFNMTVLALRTSGMVNGVSQLHGKVSRQMWNNVWPDKPVDEVPITHITNGVHLPSWLPAETHELLGRYLGPNWVDYSDEPTGWERIKDIPDDILWEHHLNLKRKMVGFLREKVRRGWVEGKDDPTQVLTGGTLLDPEALIIGFARRFATYKRATLIFKDLERLQRILLDTHRPLQIIFAGKAHPADEPGKHLIQSVYNLAKHNQLGGRIVFAEDYDMHMARYLVQGVDVWLNTPRRPREASGTSGQKAAVNGVPNLSIADGWWAEGYNGANGWTIGNAIDFDNFDRQDDHDAASLYELIEDEIVPLYYERDRDNIPRGWVAVMKESILSIAPYFNTRRMLKEYTKLYIEGMNSVESSQSSE